MVSFLYTLYFKQPKSVMKSGTSRLT